VLLSWKYKKKVHLIIITQCTKETEKRETHQQNQLALLSQGIDDGSGGDGSRVLFIPLY